MESAHLLLGKLLPNGWKVIEKIPQKPDQTGGYFSVGYIVEQGTRKGFLKALDYSKAFKSDDPARVLQAMTTTFNFERDILDLCNNARLKNIVIAFESGKYQITPYGYPVNYIIFELADGDARNFINNSSIVDLTWTLRSLHHVASGLNQLHTKNIAHQDLKPSNVLVFDDQSKIGDLGCACKKGILAPRDECSVAGDLSYAPIELLYGHLDSDWNIRRYGCDLYLLGSLILFFFTNMGMTTALQLRIPNEFRYTTWKGSFIEILPYLTHTFGQIIQEFRDSLPPSISVQITEMVSQLCEPDLSKRGHPKNRFGHQNPFSLQRYVTQLDLLATKVKLGRIG